MVAHTSYILFQHLGVSGKHTFAWDQSGLHESQASQS